MKTIVFVLLFSSLLWAQVPVTSTVSSAPAAPPRPDASLTELLARIQSAAQKSDSDLARLRIDKWKTDAVTRQQAEASAASIHRNLANAVPELMQKVLSEPGSISANFRLYRNFNVLYDIFAALVESAGAFAPGNQYTPLANDAAQIDQLRHQLAERMDLLASASDAELIRLRARPAAPSAKPIPKVVVDDNHPAAKKKLPKKKPENPSHAPQP